MEEDLTGAAVTTSFFGDDDTPHFTDAFSSSHAPWPLTPNVVAFARVIKLPPELLKPDHSLDDDGERKHLEEIKFWIRCGYHFEGIDDPRATARHIVGDIVDDRPFSSLSSKAQHLHIIRRKFFRLWWKQNHNQ